MSTYDDMFYVFVRDYYSVWEPAEGGYYVECATVRAYEEHYDLAEAVYSLLELVIDLEEKGHEVSCGNWRIEFQVDMWDDDGMMRPNIKLRLPYFQYDRTKYVGDGFEVGICMHKPEDKPYQGYC